MHCRCCADRGGSAPLLHLSGHPPPGPPAAEHLVDLQSKMKRPGESELSSAGKVKRCAHVLQSCDRGGGAALGNSSSTHQLQHPSAAPQHPATPSRCIPPAAPISSAHKHPQDPLSTHKHPQASISSSTQQHPAAPSSTQQHPAAPAPTSSMRLPSSTFSSSSGSSSPARSAPAPATSSSMDSPSLTMR